MSSSKGAAAGSRGQIRIVINSTSVAAAAAAPAAAGPAAAAGGGSTAAAAGGGGSGLKRAVPEIQDLDAEEEEEQAAKRARQGPLDGAAGLGVANGLALSELPEVVAAMNNPGQLQVRWGVMCRGVYSEKEAGTVNVVSRDAHCAATTQPWSY